MLSSLPERSGAIDAVRILGVLAIVAGHVWTRPVTAEWFYPWHVPIFLILSGYLWSEGRTMRRELKSRWQSLGRPYLAWLALLTGALLVMGLVTGEPVMDRILSGIYGGSSAILPYTTLWFVSALFFTAILYRAIDRWPMWAQWALAALGVGIGSIWGAELAVLPLGVGYAVSCLVYLLIGSAFRRLRPRVTAPVIVGMLAVALGAALVVTRVSAPLDIKLGDNGTPVISIVTASFISIGLVLIAEQVVRPGRVSRVLSLAALPMLTVVLAHPVFLWLPGPLWLKLLAGFFVPTVIGLLALRTKMAPWITGHRQLVAEARVPD